MSDIAEVTFSPDPAPVAKKPSFDWRAILKPLASLKITVTLLALAIVLVFMGTLAQTQSDIWEVVGRVFRCWFFWLEARTLQPLFRWEWIGKLSPKLGIFFPGGYAIGTAMVINLLAAHGLRFTVQAKGLRLAAGLVVTALGVLVTWLVIDSGHADSGLQDATVQWDTLWLTLEVGIGFLLLLCAAGVAFSWQEKKPEVLPLGITFFLLLGALVLMLWQGGRGIDDSGMRILWQLLKGTFAGVWLLAGSVLLFKKRAGVVVLHAGVLLILVHEPIVGSYHKEQQMRIEEGKSANFADDIRTVELAFTDPSSSDFDKVVTIPRHLLMSAAEAKDPSQQIISHDLLPFDVKVLKYYQNSSPEDPGKDDEKNLATAGAGLQMIAKEAKASVGTDNDGAVDMTASYVTLLDKKSKAELGTYLVGVYFNMLSQTPPNRVTHDGKEWDLSLRFRRFYKPYTVTLLDVSKTDYAGTDTPRDYRSVVRVSQAASSDQPKVDFEIPIWMNNPMRYAGETFYQQSYFSDPRTGKETTTLSVVRNTGWMIPYVACMIGGVGMLAHFWVIFVRFVARRSPSHQTSVGAMFGAMGSWLLGQEAPSAVPNLKVDSIEETLFRKWFPWVVAGITAVYLLGASRPPMTPAKGPDYNAFGNLPVQYEGRMQPLDSLARNSLKQISEYETFRDDKGKKHPAILWLLDVMASQKNADDHRVFRIVSPLLHEKLKLDGKRKGYRYSLNEFRDEIQSVIKDMESAREIKANDRKADHRQLLEFERRLGVLNLLRLTFEPPEMGTDNPAESVRRGFRQLQHINGRQPPRSVPPHDEYDTQLDRIVELVLGPQSMRGGKPTRLFAPDNWDTFAGGWSYTFLNLNVLQAESETKKEVGKPVVLFAQILKAHSKVRDAESKMATTDSFEKDKARKSYDEASQEFNESVAEYRRWLVNESPAGYDAEKVSLESWFNHFDPFGQAMWCYLIAMFFALIALIGWSQPMNRAAFLMMVVTFVLHTIALGIRIYLSGRPPVTNLYSSAIFIGWGALALALAYEAISRSGIGNLVGAALGASTLGISAALAADGDTIKVMQAVLDTQFWLWTHVTCITLGYAVTFVSGFAGMLFVFAGVFSNRLNPTLEKQLTQMIYGTICFGIFFSFIGTILGGLWADDSWGRFWGWDPKENGALIIVLWNALVMHAKWDGMVKSRGLAVLAIVGNMVTSWSWFGVNELGKGLHAYGFTDGMWSSLWTFWISQLICIGIGLLPLTVWVSYRNRDPQVDERPQTDLQIV